MIFNLSFILIKRIFTQMICLQKSNAILFNE